MLENAEQRLKIELMNLLKENMAIPLFTKSFDTIFNTSEKQTLNSELLWILKKGFVITSVGLHT